MHITEELTRYICEELLSGQEPIGIDESLLADGMIDSLGMLRLIAFVEDSFGYSVPPEDFTIDNFRSIKVLSAYLRRALEA